MTRDRAKELLPIIKAYSEGKEIEVCIMGTWMKLIHEPLFDSDATYRIKPTDTDNDITYAKRINSRIIAYVKKLEEENEQIKNSDTLCKLIGGQKRKIAKLEHKLEQTEKDLADYQFNYPTIKELETQIEKMKSQYDYAFNQLCESREIVCLMLSQYKNKKEIDYSTKERGEKLLKQGVYKYD